MSAADRADVCVIGGGPAGATLAIRLAQLGHRTVLIERGDGSRRRSGESLSPGIWTQLDLLGARQAIERSGFRECRRTLVDWEGSDTAVRETVGEPGLLVDRARFDAILHDTARAYGVRVLQPAAVREKRFDDDRWRLVIAADGGPVRIDAACLALAGGRAPTTGATRRATGPRTLALYASWRGIQLPREPHIVAGANEWYWGMPLVDGGYSTMVFVDPGGLRDDRTEPLAAKFARLIRRSTLLAGARSAELVSPVGAADATPFIAETAVDRHHIRVGEAVMAIDPLSSSGVQRAMQSALIGAVVVNTMLRRPGCGDAAIAFYRDNVAAASDRHQRWAAGLYRVASVGRDTGFWRERAGGADVEPRRTPVAGPPPHPELPIALGEDATMVAAPCIIGDFINVRRAIRVPGSAEPVAFVAGQEVAPLLEQLRPGMTAGDLVRSWSERVSFRSGVVLIGWMLETGVLATPADGRGGHQTAANA